MVQHAQTLGGAGQGDIQFGRPAWAVGDEDCTFIEFSRGNDYYDR